MSRTISINIFIDIKGFIMTKLSYVPTFRVDELDETLASKAVDTTVVHITGDETIEGIKNFKNNTTKKTSTTLNVANARTTQASLETQWFDKNNVSYGVDALRIDGSGALYRLISCKNTSGTWASIAVGWDSNDNVYSLAPTPPASNNQSYMYIATTGWVNNPTLSTNVVHRTGDETIAGTKTFSSVINGTALKAQWADLAENYITDTKYEEGTLIEFGGNNEVTIANKKVNGVISTKPALLLNSKEKGQAVALAGRVPVKVEGEMHRFDKLTLRSNGIARKKKWYEFYKRTIAISLETNHKPEVKKILCVTKFNID
jgi:hypothetical protein